MPPRSSYAVHLIDRLRQIEAQMMALLDASSVTARREERLGHIVVIAPNYSWGKLDNNQHRMQMDLKKSFAEWHEHFHLLFRNVTNEDQRAFKESHDFVVGWVEKSDSWSLSPDMEQNKTLFRNRIQIFYDRLQMLDDAALQRIIIVPDTNAIIAAPDPSVYSTIAGKNTFQFVILPTILAELDQLKVTHRDEAFRNKVTSIIKRIKGWRNQGSLLTGVTVNKTITVRTVAHEPRFEHTLHWLDPTNNDDRIIASVLELQGTNPSSTVVIVTSDINLQNKAEAANLPFEDAP